MNAPALFFLMALVDGGQMIHHTGWPYFSWAEVVDGSCVNSPITDGEHLTSLSECDSIAHKPRPDPKAQSHFLFLTLALVFVALAV